MIIESYTESDLETVAKQLLSTFSSHSVWCFDAEMGTGKTTLIKELCRQLQVTDEMSSPTFSIVNEYHSASGVPVYHFDFYRIKSLREAVDIGVEDYFYSGSYCFCEWPDKVEELVPDDYLKITINLEGDNQRSLIAQPNE